MPDRARAKALTVTRNSTALAKRRSNAQSALSPLQSFSAVPTRSARFLSVPFGLSTYRHRDLSTTPARLQISLRGRLGLNSTRVLARLSLCDGVGPSSAKVTT